MPFSESPLLRPVAARIVEAAMAAVEPGAAVCRFLGREGRALLIDGHKITPAGRVRVLALGKAARGMALAAANVLAGFDVRGLVISPGPVLELPPGFEGVAGGHPLPDEGSLQAGRKALELVRGLEPDDLLLCLISGGGSALMTAPREGVTLAELQSLTRALLACGARIDEINSLRRRLDRLKGGGLARAAAPARTVSLILSDVVNSPLEAIASGPTAPDPASSAQALAVLDKFGLTSSTPPGILAALRNPPVTPLGNIFERVQNILVGSNELAARAAVQQARAEGLQAAWLGSHWQGEARQVALELCARLKICELTRPFCLVAGGETTVTLRGHGRGGRNQELALAAALELDGLPDVLLLSLATDGVDGPTDAAGALVDGDTLRRARSLGLDAVASLHDNDSHTFFNALGDLLRQGPTGTNVNDLVFLFGF